MGLNDDMYSKLAAFYGPGTLNDLVKQHESAQGLNPGTLFTQAYYLTALPTAGLTPVSTDYNDMAAQYWANVNLEPVLISDQILTSTSADIQFLAIPQTFRHLHILADARGDTAAISTSILLQFNNDTTSANYSIETAQAKSAAIAAAALAGFYVGSVPAATGAASNSGALSVWVPNYTGTTFFKHGVAQSVYFDGTDRFMENNGTFYNSTAAITRIDLKPNAGNFIIGSRFTLYGLN